MMLRRIYLVLVVIIGVFSFGTPMEAPRLPQVAQTELVFSAKEAKEVFVFEETSAKKEFFVFNESISKNVHFHRQFFLVETQHHHASL